MTIKRQEQFVWGHHEDSGMSGWILASMPHFDPVQGFALAHDMLEHTDTYPGMEGECMAFGGIVYIRVEGGYFDQEASSRGRRPDRVDQAQTLGYELAGFFKHDDGDQWSIERIEEPPLEDQELDQFILDVARHCSRYSMDFHIDEDEDWQKRRDVRVASINTINWMRRGYRKCVAFWDAGNPEQMCALFQDIQSSIDTEIAHCEYQQGDRISVHINEDLTWGWETIDGFDADGDYWENGELANPSDSEEEDEDDE